MNSNYQWDGALNPVPANDNSLFYTTGSLSVPAYSNGYTYYTSPGGGLTTNGTNQIKISNNTFSTTLTYNINTMKCTVKQEDDKIVLIGEVAGFRKDEVKVKYYAPADCKESPYIHLIAESATHALKSKSQDTYKLEYKANLNGMKKVDFSTAKTSYENGLVIVSVEWEETSKIKELPIA
jgi:HSP20 family molecular chaperone IbpA